MQLQTRVSDAICIGSLSRSIVQPCGYNRLVESTTLSSHITMSIPVFILVLASMADIPVSCLRYTYWCFDAQRHAKPRVDCSPCPALHDAAGEAFRRRFCVGCSPPGTTRMTPPPVFFLISLDTIKVRHFLDFSQRATPAHPFVSVVSFLTELR